MTSKPPLPDWLLERMAVDELPPGRSDRAELAQRADEPEVAARLETLQASNQEILAAYPPATVAAEVERRTRLAEARAGAQRARSRPRPRPRPMWQWALAGSAAVAAAVAVAVVTRSDGPGEMVAIYTPGTGPGAEPSAEVVRPKGDARLLVFRKRAEAVEALERNAVVRPGDLLQLSYLAAGRPHGVVLSIDGGGAVTLHYPERPDGDTALAEGGPVSLAHSYQLDDAPEFERFFLITADRAIAVEDLLESARALADEADRARAEPLALSPGLDQYSILLRKESQP
ncbi:hypothetical protein [Haliangium sp.]|uniref:hypothetical protein n=1 Tax=Haliangium sp. TaxID=2663208 RepID=UPI003D0EABC1